jgi:ABC-type transport system substrate-binding protein
MTTTIKNLIPAKQAESAATAQYTANNCKTIVDKFTVTNTTGSPVPFTLNLVASGGAAGASNTIISAKNIAAGETYTCPEVVGHTVESGGFISTLAGSATALTIRASGREIT